MKPQSDYLRKLSEKENVGSSEPDASATFEFGCEKPPLPWSGRIRRSRVRL